MKITDLNPHGIKEIVQPIFAPFAWLKDGRVYPLDNQSLLVQSFCDFHNIPLTKRDDVWGDLLEPYVDTEFSPEHQERTKNRLKENGFSEVEVTHIREKVGSKVLKYNSIVWDWVHLSYGDLFRAHEYTPEDVDHNFLSWASEIASRGWRKLDSPPLYSYEPSSHGLTGRFGLADLLPETRGRWFRFKTEDPSSKFKNIERVCQAIEAQMAGPGRAYHNIRHLEEALELGRQSYYHQVKSLSGLSKDASYRALSWAILFHDFIYVAGAKDNERRSAEIAFEALQELGISKEAALTKSLIEWTQTHDKRSADSKAFRALFDADMGIFGLGPTRYDQYAADVRAEWVNSGAVTNEQFNEGRRAFLQKLLKENEGGDFFFALDPLHSQMARENASRELRNLGCG